MPRSSPPDLSQLRSAHLLQAGTEPRPVDMDRINAQLAPSLQHHAAHASLKHGIDVDAIGREKLKKVCRQGLRHEVRADVWMYVTGAREIKNKDQRVYARETDSLFRTHRVDAFPVDPFFGHSDNFEYHNLSHDGFDALRRICLVLSVLAPDVGYCPVICDIAAVCLGYMSEEDTFYLVYQLLSRSRHDEWYFPLSGTHFAVFSATFEHLVAWKLGSLHVHIVQIGAMQGLLGTFSDWISHGFIEHLPRYAFLRTLDTFLFEGAKIHYRVGLAILKIYEEELKECKDSVSFVTKLGHLSANVHDADLLLKTAFRFYIKRRHFRDFQVEVRHRITELHIPTYERPALNWPSGFSSTPSSLLTIKQCLHVWTWLPRWCQTGDIYRAFATSESGFSLGSLLQACRRGPCLVVIQNMAMQCFGAFFPAEIQTNGKAIVESELFLFSFALDQSSIYRWRHDAVDHSAFYIASSEYVRIIGSGKSALYLDGKLEHGNSEATEAFMNEPLHGGANSFQIKSIEVWAFTDGNLMPVGVDRATTM